MSSNCVKPIVLSVLMPAYCYLAGIKRIVNVISEGLDANVVDQCEIIIFDNSSDDQILDYVSNLDQLGLNIRYKKNDPPTIATRNWNELLDAAKGEYVLLLHHDEFPIGRKFLSRVLEKINKNPRADVFMMDCLLVEEKRKAVRRHVPNFIRTWVLNKTPSYIFRRNVVGPTSALVVRRDLYPKFDNKLRWLIDVDVYFQLTQVAHCWLTCDDLKIGSLTGRGDSLTASLGEGVSSILCREQRYLFDKHPAAGLWLRPSHNKVSYFVESIFWIGMRFFTRLTNHLFPPTRRGGIISKTELQKVLKE